MRIQVFAEKTGKTRYVDLGVPAAPQKRYRSPLTPKKKSLGRKAEKGSLHNRTGGEIWDIIADWVRPGGRIGRIRK